MLNIKEMCFTGAEIVSRTGEKMLEAAGTSQLLYGGSLSLYIDIYI
jgi:hypothetical protein